MIVNNLLSKNIFDGIKTWQLVVVGIVMLAVASVIIRLMFLNRKLFGIILASLFPFIGMAVFLALADFSKKPFPDIKIAILIVLFGVFPIIVFTLVKSDILRKLETIVQLETKKIRKLEMSSSSTRKVIADVVFELSQNKIGALITLEKYTSLSQFSERAIPLNSDVTKELLMNIFIPNTPLHDGAIIIRRDKIICAGAYFNLTKSGSYEKTTGSRHRAAIGISEVSDALTVVVSEETGDISVTYGALLMPVVDQKTLMNYLDYLDD